MTESLVMYPLFFPSVGPMELAVVMVVVLILFGPGKLPEVFRALGDGVRQFKESSKGLTPSSEPPASTVNTDAQTPSNS